MGYFSELDIDLAWRKAQVHDCCYPSETAYLQNRLDYLQDCLDALNETRPHDPLHPLYDRYFYMDHISDCYEEPTTVQGLLQAISELEAKIAKEESQQNKKALFYLTALLTGADQDGQCVLIDVFAPPHTAWLTIAA